MKKIISFLLTISLTLTMLCGCESKVQYEYFNEVYSGPFDTVIYFNAYAKDREEFDQYYDILKENFSYLDQIFDRYTSYRNVNNIKTINDQAGKKAVKVDPIVIDLITTWMNEYNDVSGKVNIALGPLLELWHNAREDAKNTEKGPIGVPPSTEELEEAMQYCNIEDIVVDTENNTVFLKDPHSSIDVGAIAKGYAVEYTKDKLIEAGAESFLISAGGNVAGHGIRKAKANGNENVPRSKDEFLVGINSPRNGAYEAYDSIVAVALATDISIVTSGDYERYFLDEEGNYYSHLIDGATMYPAQYFRSVTVFTEDSGYADFLSTTLFLMDWQEGMELVNSLDGVEGLWLLNDGTYKTTDGLVSGENFYSFLL